MKYFLTLILFSMNSQAQLFETCKNLFVAPEIKMQWPNEKTFARPYSQSLFDKVYKTALDWPLLSQKEKQKYILDIEKSVSFAESLPQAHKKLDIMNPQLIEAVEAFPQLLKFAEKNPSHSHLNVKQGLEIALVSLTKYTMAFVNNPNDENLDLARWSAIMRAIAHFKKEPTAFSLYKIIRAVKEKHSLYEYLNCK